MSEQNKRGGARKGAGRPKSEPTVMVRVPQGCLLDVRCIIEKYRADMLLGTEFDNSVKSNLRSDIDEYNQMISESIDL
ncbi:hypothetical protein [Shewanella xiamenensis]|uniref:hypothetical protein n=1 Tax=Shewanella xiamenensis TaxID=332186 RepID=UPI001F061A61|nr:hypothetical protein [Shewanella xiamenensis]UML95631.1 hypothetical protein MKD32_10215 [Shewanella xiamenensis]UML95642.1 hypothetical protein MKD32_10270 [Shewanella xiamenensis]